MSRKDYGLTGEGGDLVRLANRLGVMVDLSHTGPRTGADTMELSESPPFFSHSNVRSVEVSKRNVSDELLKKTAERKGIVGLTFIRSCIGTPFTSAKIAEHAKRMIAIGGEALPALGTDFLGMRDTPEGLENLSKLGDFESELRNSALSGRQVSGIVHDNAFRFIWDHAEKW